MTEYELLIEELRQQENTTFADEEPYDDCSLSRSGLIAAFCISAAFWVAAWALGRWAGWF